MRRHCRPATKCDKGDKTLKGLSLVAGPVASRDISCKTPPLQHGKPMTGAANRTVMPVDPRHLDLAAAEVKARWAAGQAFHANAGSVRSLDAWCKATLRIPGRAAAAIVDRLVLDGRIEPVRRGLKLEHWRPR